MRNPAISVRTSLEIGFADGELPECYRSFRGANWRAVGVQKELPYEDAQFQVVIMHESAVSLPMVKEAHRVLKSGGMLYFTVTERGKNEKDKGFTPAEACSLLRDGFNIVGIENTPGWQFWVRPRVISIRAQKKNWKTLNNSYRPYVV